MEETMNVRFDENIYTHKDKSELFETQQEYTKIVESIKEVKEETTQIQSEPSEPNDIQKERFDRN